MTDSGSLTLAVFATAQLSGPSTSRVGALTLAINSLPSGGLADLLR